MHIVYQITCTANGKFYIGSTVNKHQRWARHRGDLRKGIHKNRNMQASWSKYGEEAFVFVVVEEVSDPVQLMAAEQRRLDACVGDPQCFNHNKFADAPWRGKSGPGTPMYGRTQTDEARAKISAATSGENNANWGIPVPPERRERIAASNKAFPHTEARHTPETKAKIGEAGRGRPQSLQTRAKRSTTLQGHEISTLTRLKISQSLQGEGNFWYGKKRGAEFSAKVSRPIIATNPAGLEFRYDSITYLRRILELSPPTVNRALKSGEPLTRGPRSGWSFRYAV